MPLSYVATKPMVLTSRPNGLRLVVENALGNARLSLDLMADGNSTDMMTALVSRGLAYSVPPYCAVWSALKRGELRAAPVAGLLIDWLLLYPSQRSASVATTIRFKETFREVTQKRSDADAWVGVEWSVNSVGA